MNGKMRVIQGEDEIETWARIWPKANIGVVLGPASNLIAVDIDTDFEPRIRNAVIDYIVKRFGRDYVSAIGTFGITRLKVAIQDVARVFGIKASEVITLTKNLFMVLNILFMNKGLNKMIEMMSLQGAKIFKSKFLKQDTRHHQPL